MYKNLLQGLNKTKFINYRKGSPDKMFVDERPLQVHFYGLRNPRSTRCTSRSWLQESTLQSFFYAKVGTRSTLKTKMTTSWDWRPSARYIVQRGNLGSYLSEKLFDGMALLSGGGYAQYLKVKRSQVMKMPQKLKYAEAAAITEVWLTAYQILKIGKARAEMNVAINGASGSVGSAAIQICSLLRANPYVIVTR